MGSVDWSQYCYLGWGKHVGGTTRRRSLLRVAGLRPCGGECEWHFNGVWVCFTPWETGFDPVLGCNEQLRVNTEISQAEMSMFP